MNISSSSAHYSSVQPIYPALGQKPVGLESADGRKAAIKPVEQGAAAGKSGLQARKLEALATKSQSEEAESSSKAESKPEQQTEARKEEAMRQEIQQLAQRDREVRAHEQAHMAAGGAHAGAARYDYVKGPDGVSYAVSGEVPIDTGPAPTPQASLEKAQALQRAALAPADPSSQDRRVAAQAMQLEIQALQEISTQREEARREAESSKEKNDDVAGQGKVSTAKDANSFSPGQSGETIKAKAVEGRTGVNESRREEATAASSRNPYQPMSAKAGNLLDTSA